MIRFFISHYALLFLLVGCGKPPPAFSPSPSQTLQSEVLLSRYQELSNPHLRNYLTDLHMRLTSSLRGSDITYPTLIIIDEEDPLAFTSAGTKIVLSSGLILRLSVEAELAFIIAHEYAHVILGHLSQDSSASQELAADAAAIKILTAARYDPMAILNVISLFEKAHSATHPSLQIRSMSFYKNLLTNSWSRSGTVDRRDFQTFKQEVLRAAR